VVWEILLALADGEKHGYAILLEVERRGAIELLPGSLYRALNRLERARWIEESAVATEGDSRRRVFRLTARGKRAATAEAKRLADAADEARRRGLLPRPGESS
jgi:DNA-binding PadR family transcriptional regulator